MKLKVFFASDGDCLLLSSRDGRHALIDGGRSTTFEREAWPVIRDLPKIDLLVVSHIDADHITGILWLMERVKEWVLFDHQRGAGRNSAIREPAIPRPPEIERFWHNAWRDQLGDLAGPIEAYLGEVGDGLELAPPDRSQLPREALEAIEAMEDLAESVPQGAELLRLVDDDTPIVRNEGFKRFVLRGSRPKIRLGSMSLTVLGPGRNDLERLKNDWRKFLEKPAPAGPQEAVSALVEAAAQIIATADAGGVTPPNRASITLLAEEDGRSCLLTGDAGEPEILAGLRTARRLTRGRFRCDVLKVQHHGASANISVNFARAVVADHYVFCADGNHANPEPDVVKTIAETRAAEDPGRPFTLWFNCTPSRTLETRRQAMTDAIGEAKAAARAHPEITVEVLERRRPFFELTV